MGKLTARHPELPPGPALPRLLQTARWVARPTEFMNDCMRRYGDVFTLRLAGVSEAIFVADPEAIRKIFTSSPDKLHAGESNAILEPVVGDRSLLLLDGAEHLRERKLLLPPLHGERMQSYRGLIEKIAERDIDQWPLEKPFALRPRTQGITLDVIMRAVFGIEEGERFDRLRELLLELTDFGRSRVRWVGLVVPAFRRRIGFGKSLWERFIETRDKVDALLYEEIARRRSETEIGVRDDILSLLLQATHEDGRPMSAKELRDELMTLLVAGHETTATALAWSFELLVRNPASLSALEQEIETGGDAYLDAVIKETLRLRPVLPIVGRLLKEPMTLNGYVLPGGTMLAPCIYLTHRHPEVYSEPERFRPERFLDTREDTYAWLPFGGGVRRCVGASFAMFEMKVVIPTVLRRMRLHPVGEQPEPVRRRGITFVPGREALVVAQPRMRGCVPTTPVPAAA